MSNTEFTTLDKKKIASSQKQVAVKEKSLADAPREKKIGFFSAMLIVMGSSIGAGIFFKSKAVLTGAQENFILAIFSWLIAAFAVISMALALIEIASARNDNLSIIGWCKTFNSRTIYKASKNFMFYVYLPLTYFFMPLYAIMALQDGIGAFNHSVNSFGTNFDWIIWTIISLCISVYFIFVSGLSSRVGNIHNIIITSIKFIPLIVAGLIGFIYVGLGEPSGIVTDGFTQNTSTFDPTVFSKLSPGLGMFIAIAGIFFAFDGFYVTAGIQTEMKEPKKTPLAILFGLGAVTIIYLLIAISMSLNGTGDFYSFGEFLIARNAGWVFGIVNIFIAVGVLGIINGFAMWAPRFTQDLIKEKELPFSEYCLSRYGKSKLMSDKFPMIGVYYSLIISVPIIIIFSIIGSLGYVDVGGYSGLYGSFYTLADGTTKVDTSGMAKLYSFADLMANWTSLFAFSFITAAIYGCLKNRKTQVVKTDKKKYFVPTAIISIILIGITLMFSVIDPIFTVFMLFLNGRVGANYTVNIQTDAKLPPIYSVQSFEIKPDAYVGRIMIVIVLVIYIGMMFVPTLIEDTLKKRKGLALNN